MPGFASAIMVHLLVSLNHSPAIPVSVSPDLTVYEVYAVSFGFAVVTVTVAGLTGAGLDDWVAFAWLGERATEFVVPIVAGENDVGAVGSAVPPPAAVGLDTIAVFGITVVEGVVEGVFVLAAKAGPLKAEFGVAIGIAGKVPTPAAGLSTEAGACVSVELSLTRGADASVEFEGEGARYP